MANEGYFNFGGLELVNHARLAQLAPALGIKALRLTEAKTDWIWQALQEDDYPSVETAPWYDSGYEASSEFAGVLALDVRGLGDSTLEATPSEYNTDGGSTGMARNAMLTLVWNVVIVASTERGAEFGKRWLDRTLATRQGGSCSGSDLSYYRWADFDSPKVHRRNVAVTRGTSITRKRKTACHTLWWATFTMTAGDPFEYGEHYPKITSLGGANAVGSGAQTWGTLALTHQDCPVYDYSPLYDPAYPALVAAPAPPQFLPDGWTIKAGDAFQRSWVRISTTEPSVLSVVPFIKLTTSVSARMVRVGIWPYGSPTNDQCDPLFGAVVSYVPAALPVYLDGEQAVPYAWDGFSPSVRRTDSLTYSHNADPVEWTTLNDSTGLLVTLDVFAKTGGGYEGDGNVRLALDLIPKSD